MNRIQMIGAFSALVIPSVLMGQQPPLEISSVDADPPALACSSGPKQTTITVQIYFQNHDTRVQGKGAVVDLSISSATPVGNTLSILGSPQKVKLQQSPGIATFKVTCDSATVAGQVALVASIAEAPTGIDVSKEFGRPNSVVKISIR